MADILAQALPKHGEDDEDDDDDSKRISECQRSKDLHQRCTNDNPTGHDGFKRCCRALSGYLFSCMHDREALSLQQRSLFAPSYDAFCKPEGYMPLPEGWF